LCAKQNHSITNYHPTPTTLDSGFHEGGQAVPGKAEGVKVLKFSRVVIIFQLELYWGWAVASEPDRAGPGQAGPGQAGGEGGTKFSESPIVVIEFGLEI
jgi:hypothetical protein